MTAFDQVDTYRTVAVTGTPRSTRYGYDNLGRLTTATDRTLGATGVPSGAACTRSYAFDVNSNRVALTQTASAGAPAGTCPATVPAGDSYGYDTADRLQPIGARGALRYDALGRTRTLPSVDTIGAGGDVGIDYYVDDLVASMTQAGKTTTFGLDAAARRTVRTDTDAATPGISRKTISYYTGDDDNPDVVKESDNSFTRNVLSFGGLVATVTKSGTAGAAVTMQLANLHGDIAATVPMTATSPNDLVTIETTEYGVPRVAPAAGTTQGRYGWLGSHQRDASTLGGLTLMGVRLYAPILGRFLSLDPIKGGNANAYVYPADPVNQQDISGLYNYRNSDLVGPAGTIYTQGGCTPYASTMKCNFNWAIRLHGTSRTSQVHSLSVEMWVDGRRVAGPYSKVNVKGNYNFHGSIGNGKAGFGLYRWNKRAQRDPLLILQKGQRVELRVSGYGTRPNGQRFYIYGSGNFRVG